MGFRIVLLLICWAVAQPAVAQQVAEIDFSPEVSNPRFLTGTGPVISIDAAHYNFHTADGRYRPMADVLRAEGYRVESNEDPFTRQTLSGVDVLCIVNALNERNQGDWSLPTPSAFTPEEISAVRDWVAQGGALFLVADHMPFPGAAESLGNAFGVTFSNGYARPAHREKGIGDTFEFHNGLIPSELTCGRACDAPITRVTTFGGSAFVPPAGSLPILLFAPGARSFETTKAPGITDGAPEVPVGGWCQGAVFGLGCGRVAVFGEAAMFSAQLSGSGKRAMGMNAPGAEQNHQLLRNVVAWLAKQK